MSTTTYHGTTMVVTKQKLDARIAKEYIGTLSGGAVDQTFYTKNFPITDSSGVATDVEANAPCYTDDGTPGTYSAYATDGTDYEIDGSTGAVTIKAAENQAPNAGEKIYIEYYTKIVVARAQGITLTQEGNVVNVHELGNRAPQELKAGKIEIDLQIQQFYINRDMFGGFLGLTGLNERLTEFTIFLDPNGTTSGQPRITITGKFTGGTLQTNIDSILLNNVNFKGMAVDIGTVP